MKEARKASPPPEAVAIIGMSCRFPDAAGVEDFWHNLRQGVESVRFFSPEELAAAGVDPALARDPAYVPAGAPLAGIELFDAGFFGFNPKVAAATDPQQRLFLECAWEALERAGYDSAAVRGPVGLFAGVGINGYFLSRPAIQRQLMGSVGALQTAIGNRTDHLTTMVAYKLNLRGPAVTVQTTCSTSLVAVHLACQSLLTYQCQMALAGSARVSVPQNEGYLYQAGDILSPDGHCRPFDARAQGTLSGSGVGVVVLKRLADAHRDGDWIHAVIRGSAINNDGSVKAGYTAPSVEGQAKVIAMAQALAGVQPGEVTYVEAHGTATPLGDPIEVAALNRVFRAKTERKGFCALGSVKSNLGHLDTAAGIAGLIKTALALENRQIPPSLHFERPNPELGLEDSPFYVNAELRDWEVEGGVRRAGVSSFGIGGTNAHLVLEEAPTGEPPGPSRPWQLLLLSAGSAAALDRATENLRRHLEQNPRTVLADAAYTLRVGRRAMEHRRAVVCRHTAEAVELLGSLDPAQVHTSLQQPRQRPVVFLFPGQGSQAAGMGARLYAAEAVFRQEVDRCCGLLAPVLGLDLRQELFNAEPGRLDQTFLTQPALFTFEYALARLWMSWGISPRSMIGHSLGEYVAACLAGVFSLEDALRLVAERGRLIQSLPAGAMLSVRLPEAELRERLGPELSLAAVNRPSLCVVSGPAGAIDRLERELAAEEVGCRRLRTSHAFHSAMMDPVLAPFVAALRRIELRPPAIPFVSNLTGRWIEPHQATDPDYWVRHLRSTVRFGEGAEMLLREHQDGIFLEAGPGMVLSGLLRQHPAKSAGHVVLAALDQGHPELPEESGVLIALGRLWLAGAEPDWAGFHAGERRRRVPLPTYPFERRRYWLDEGRDDVAGDPLAGEWQPDMADWFWVPSWQRAAAGSVPRGGGPGAPGEHWLVFVDGTGLGERAVARLRAMGHEVVCAAAGEGFSRLGEDGYFLTPGEPEHYRSLLADLRQRDQWPQRILHLWTVEPAGAAGEILERGFYSLLDLAQALGQQEHAPLRIDVVSAGMQEVMSGDLRWPEKAAVLGPCRVIPKEYPGVLGCRSIDLGADETGNVEPLLAELLAGHSEPTVALRGGYRWVQSFTPLRLERSGEREGLRPGGVYLITGGFGGMGRSLAEYLARTVAAKLVLVGRTPLLHQVQELERLGAEVLVCAADVTDERRMREVVAETLGRFGALHGVFHTAGVSPGGLAQLKTREAAARVMAPKVVGTLALAAALAGVQLDVFVLCSSRSAIFAPPGGIDYAAANAFQDAFAHSARLAGFPGAVSINWCGWEEVGMLAEATGRRARPEERGPEPGEEDAGHPLLGRLHRDSVGREIYSISLSARTHWMAHEHRIAGRPVVPGTTYLEMIRAAMARGGARQAEIHNVFFLSPMRLREDEVREVRLVLERSGDEAEFYVESRTSGPGSWERNMFGKARALTGAALERFDIARIAERCRDREVFAFENDEQSEDLGARWLIVKRVLVGPNEVLAALELPETFAADLEQYRLHPSLLDRSASIGEIFLGDGAARLPFSYESLKVKAPLPRKIYSYARRRNAAAVSGETLSFDVSVLDEEGNELVAITGYHKKRVNDFSTRLRHRGDADPLAPTGGDGAGTGESRAETTPRTGITPAEGVEVFRRVLAYAVPPQVVVSPNDLPRAVAAAEALRPVLAGPDEPDAAAALRHDRPDLAARYAEPENEVQRTLAGLWSEVLGFRQVGIHDNFFELGGDSLLAIQIIARARRAGLDIAPNQIFEHQTVAELASRLAPAAGPATGLAAATPPLVPVPRQGAVPLSASQQRLWYLQRLDPDSSVLNLTAAMRLAGRLDEAALERSFNEILRRHEVLRARFSEAEGEPVQSFAPYRPVLLPLVDLGGLPRSRREPELARVIDEQAQLHFDLSRGPLLRSVAVRVAGDEHVVFYGMHHIIGDGWSLGLLGWELGEVYEAFAAGCPSPLPELPVQYADFVHWQRQEAGSERLERQLAYWRRQLAGSLPVLELSGQRRRPAVPSFRGASRPILLSRPLVASLDELGRAEGATLFMTLLAGFKALLHHYSGQEDLLVGTNVANRNRDELEGLIGYFVNTLALRTDLSGSPSFRELVRRVRDVSVAAYAHQEVPFERVLEDLDLQRFGEHAPVFQTMFVFRTFPVVGRQVDALEMSPFPLPERMANFDLTLVMTEEGEGFLLYSTDLFEEATINRMEEHYQALLLDAAADPDQPVSALSMGEEAHERLLTADFNDDF